MSAVQKNVCECYHTSLTQRAPGTVFALSHSEPAWPNLAVFTAARRPHDARGVLRGRPNSLPPQRFHRLHACHAPAGYVARRERHLLRAFRRLQQAQSGGPVVRMASETAGQAAPLHYIRREASVQEHLGQVHENALKRMVGGDNRREHLDSKRHVCDRSPRECGRGK